MADIIDYEVNNGVAVIRFNSPETRNLLSVPFTDLLVAALDRASRDMDVRCVILTAVGEIFSAGGNIKDMHAGRGHFAGGPADVRRKYLTGVQRITRALDALEPPIIAAVNGPAMGAGFDMALMCDLRIASETALFAQSFVKLGLVSAAGGAWYLTRMLGPAVAAELALTGDTIDAARALELGIVSRVVPRERLLDEALTLARRITRHPPHSVRLNKKLLKEAPRQDLASALDMAATYQALAQNSEDHREAVAAVVEKRSPTFHSR